MGVNKKIWRNESVTNSNESSIRKTQEMVGRIQIAKLTKKTCQRGVISSWGWKISKSSRFSQER